MQPDKTEVSNTSRNLTAWINKEERLISFHPVPGFARFSPGDGERFWAKVRALVEEGYRLQ